MTKLTYSEKLSDPRWQKKRLEVMGSDDFTCTQCGSKSITLNVHHGYYAFKKDPWDYDRETLHTVCENCHKLFEEVKSALYRELGKLSIQDLREVFKIVSESSNPVSEEVFHEDVARESIKRWIACTMPNLHQIHTYLNSRYPSASLDFKSEFLKYAKGGRRGFN